MEFIMDCKSKAFVEGQVIFLPPCCYAHEQEQDEWVKICAHCTSECSCRIRL